MISLQLGATHDSFDKLGESRTENQLASMPGHERRVLDLPFSLTAIDVINREAHFPRKTSH